MKKTYIEPETTAIKLATKHTLLNQSQVEVSKEDYNPSAGKEILSRETVSAPDAWDEW